MTMIDIQVIASGSSGNCYKISDQSTSLLIEAGIRFRKIQEAINFKMSDISGCLISHSHLDHCRDTDKVLKVGIDCYLSEDTRKSLGVSGHRVHVYEALKIFEIGTFKILPFPVQHDAENHGFLIQSQNGGKLLFATDTYYLKYRFKGLTHIMIECNYSTDILEANIKDGVTPAQIRNRVLKSHFELENVKKFLLANDLSSVREIYLIHVSGTNGDKERFIEEIKEITGKPVF